MEAFFKAGTLVLIVLLFQFFNNIAFFMFWPVSVVISIILVVVAFFQKRKRLAWTLLLSSPIIFIPISSLIGGTLGYFNGSAEIRGHGLWEGERHNLHPVYRCFKRSSGCCVSGSEVFFEAPNNYTIHYLTQWFGPMSGSYQGPYPSKLEAFKILQEKGTTIHSTQLLLGEFEVGSVSVKIPRESIDDCIWPLNISDRDQLKLVLVENQCLIISKGLTRSDPFYEIRNFWQPMILIDLHQKKMFARYIKPPEELFEKQ